jgi:two-component system heavy metal sensor histidine kinase CusS
MASCVIVGLFGLAIDRWFRSYLTSEHARQIVSRLYFIRSELDVERHEEYDEQHELEEVRDLVERENQSRHFSRVFVRITDARGRGLMRTAGMEALEARRPPFPASRESIDDVEIRFWQSGNNHYVLSSFAFGSESDRRIASVALDRTSEAELIAGFRTKAILGLLIAMLASSAAAAVIARKALEPIGDLAARAAAIDAANLNQDFFAGRYPPELRALAQSLSEMQERLRESIDGLRRFSADLAHELRTPLTNMMGEAEVVLSTPRDAGEYKTVVESSMEELARLARIIDSLLFLARAERRSEPVDLADVDLADEVAAVVEFYGFAAEEKQIRVTTHGTAHVRVSSGMVRRAISNVVANAIHYTPAGGHVDVSVEPRREGGATVRVADSGRGIPAEQRAKVFDRFFRGDQARSAYSEGSGLGLSIVKSIMDLHRGEVSISSNGGSGTVVSLSFPPCPRESLPVAE